jgi:hypothetical protein
VHPPQDEIPLHCNVLNQETPKLLHDALDLATVRVLPRELEAASGAISKMMTISVADRVASEINNADNPITLIDSQFSSFLNTLSKFNNVVTNIATV